LNVPSGVGPGSARPVKNRKRCVLHVHLPFVVIYYAFSVPQHRGRGFAVRLRQRL
jgi:hypothetical protein